METKKITRSAVLIAVGIILPMLFHNFGISGKIFLPMHFPPLIAGFIVGPVYGAIIGFVLPLINFAINGMPAMPMAALMSVELAIFGLVTGLLYAKFKYPFAISNRVKIIFSLILAMLAGRIVYSGLSAIFIEFENPLIMIAGGVSTGLPGIIGQLLLIPIIVFAIEKS